MDYEQLTAEYLDDHIVQALYSREVEWFHYDFDRRNFEHMLETLPPGPAREDIEARIAATLTQMDLVERVYMALKAQIRSPEAHAAALARAAAARAV